MSHLWQTCIPCKHSLNVCRLLAQHGITPSHPGVSRLRVPSCLTPFSLGCWQAKCLMLSNPHLQHCILKPMKMENLITTDSKQNRGEEEDLLLKQPPSPGSVKRPHSSNSGDSKSEPVDSAPCTAKPHGPTSKLFRMDAHLHPQLLATFLPQIPAKPYSQASFHTTAGSSNELQFIESTSSSRQKRKIEWNPDLMAQKLRRLRQWEPIAKTHSESSQEFTLMSYNILAQRLLEYNSDLYGHCDREVLDWKYRCDHILQELIETNADIVCLQEVQEDHLDETLMPNLLKSGYVGLYKKRTGDKNDGCAIFYKEDKFDMEGWLPIEYNKPGVYVLNRDNIGIVALLRPRHDKKSDTRLCVATTHLLFNPRRGDVKLAQLQVLFSEMDRLAFRELSPSGRPLYHPVIICGDMNSEPHSEIYKFMSSGSLHYEGLPIATLSGQGEYYGRTLKFLTPELLPPYLGITDQCQFAKIQTARLCSCRPSQICKQASASDETMEVAVSTSLSEDVCTGPSETNDQSSSMSDKLYSMPVFSSGVMRHSFNLMSVYDHTLSRRPFDPEVTTQHTRASCTVDYIFYSVKKKRVFVEDHKLVKQDVVDSDLKLLSRYGLLSAREIRSIGGLPNAVCPSDHLPLIAKFSLDL